MNTEIEIFGEEQPTTTLEFHRIKHVLGEFAGYIRIVTYNECFELQHIEYGLRESFRNKGIMSKELPLFLSKVKKDYPNLIATVSKDNIYSIKLLEKNNFLRIKETECKYWYILISELSIKEAKRTLEEFKEKYSEHLLKI